MTAYQNLRRPRFPKGAFSTILILILSVVIISRSTVIVRAGQGGVVYRTLSGGVDVNKTFSEGFHLIAPWNSMIKYEVRQQEIFETMSVLSSNGLEIELDASAWYQPRFEQLGYLHKTRGKGYTERVIMPAIRSATRSVVGRYTPEQIYSTKRDAIQNEIFEETKKILDNQYIQLNSVLVRDVTLPSTIKEAIERKLRQEQEALEYEFRLKKASQEAERQRIDAEGKARANQILSASLTDKILREKGIEATLELARSENSKVVVIGNSADGMPLILGN